MLGNKRFGPKDPEYKLYKPENGKKFASLCPTCGRFFDDEGLSRRHDKYCPIKFKHKKCSMDRCSDWTTYKWSKINLCLTHYANVLCGAPEDDKQKQYIMSTFKNGWMPMCIYGCGRRVSRSAMLDEHELLCAECCITNMRHWEKVREEMYFENLIQDYEDNLEYDPERLAMRELMEEGDRYLKHLDEKIAEWKKESEEMKKDFK